MLAGTTLDAAIGLVFIFLLFSLFLSTALESVAAIFKLRARALEIAVMELIADPDREPPWRHWPSKGLFGLLRNPFRKPAVTTDGPNTPSMLRAPALDPTMSEMHEADTEVEGDLLPALPLRFADIFHHPLVAPGRSRPSYIPTQDFATALLHNLRVGGTGSLAADVERGIALLPQGTLRQALTAIVAEAQGDWDKLRAGVEGWFDNAMDRLSGSYKRFSQAMTFLFAFLLALGFQIDAIGIVERLMVDPPLRNALVAQATTYIEQHKDAPPAALPAPADPKAQADDFKKRIDAMEQARDQLADVFAIVGPRSHETPQGWARYLAGILITALAGMLGAPFWFDLLQKMVNLRGAGPKPSVPDRPAKGGDR